MRASQELAFERPFSAHTRDIGTQRKVRSRRNDVHLIDERKRRIEIAFPEIEVSAARAQDSPQIEHVSVQYRFRWIRESDLRRKLADCGERLIELFHVAHQ